MTDTITATPSFKGKEVATETYSVKTYADAILSDDNQPEDLKTLVGSMLNYNMTKEKYECTELDIMKFVSADVITTSGPLDDEPDDQYMMPIR